MTLVTGYNVEVRESPVHGWGVFATEDMPEGTVVEESPLSRSSINVEYNRHTSLNNYFWMDEHDNYIFSLGLASVFNRSDNPNMKFEAFLEDNFYRFTTSREVQKDEELFIDYSKRILR